jgi:hypothetical protein
MCLFLDVIYGFSTIFIDVSLSQCNIIGRLTSTPKSVANISSHVDSLQAFDIAMYYASIDENAVEDCRFDNQVTGLSPSLCQQTLLA